MPYRLIRRQATCPAGGVPAVVHGLVRCGDRGNRPDNFMARGRPMESNRLEWARRLNALAQTGLTFAENPYDIERYTAIRTIAAEMIAQGSGWTAGQVLDLLACDAGYATPKVDVRGVVFRDGKILLVQERSDGLWTLPGGWADVGDSPADAVVREIREESGYETRATKLLALLDRNRHGHPPHVNHIYKVFIRCEIIGGSPDDEPRDPGCRLLCGGRDPGVVADPDRALPDRSDVRALSTSRPACRFRLTWVCAGIRPRAAIEARSVAFGQAVSRCMLGASLPPPANRSTCPAHGSCSCLAGRNAETPTIRRQTVREGRQPRRSRRRTRRRAGGRRR